MRLTLRLCKLALVVVLASVALGNQVSAQGGVSACINPAGQMRMIDERGSCHPQEHLVTWPTQAGSGPVVLDANGTRVGWFSGSTVLMHVDDQWFTVFVTREGFSTNFGLSFAYLSADCTGPRYLSNMSSLLAPSAVVFSQQATFVDNEAPKVFVNGTPEQPVTISTQLFGPNGPISPCFSTQVPTTIALSPSRSVDVSRFVPPFRLTN
jgi:hypothetical protein